MTMKGEKTKYWSPEEEFILCNRITSWSPEAIAKRINRTAKAVSRKADRIRAYPTKHYEFIPTGEASKILHCSTSYLRWLARTKKIPARKLRKSNRWLFKIGDVYAYHESNCQNDTGK